MADPRYDIYFRGEVLSGHDEAQVKQSIAKLFKASNEKLVQLFSGKVNVIKKSVDKPTAEKYQKAFKQAGAKAVITLAKSDIKTEDSSRKTEGRTPDEVKDNKEKGAHWDVLPAGSDLLKPDERHHIPEVNVDISGIKMVSPFEEITVKERPAPVIPKVDHISVAEVGEDMNPDRPAPPPEPELDLSEFSVAEAGVTLVEKKEKEIPPIPDTTHIKLV